ncbi:MAG: hypothetical protein P1V20_03975 [Verrucomicrobiales bacterium]|nr:hypothetical protein [Verrucomicrobiales bacterium]
MQDLTQSLNGGELSVNPFSDDVYSPQSPIPGTPQIHQRELNHCLQAIEKMIAHADSPACNESHGDLITITSPLAGYGKTHLIQRISKTMLNSVSTIELSPGTRLSWNELLVQTLKCLDSSGNQSTINNSLLDEAGAYFLSNLIGTAVAQGVIEERDCPVPLSTFQEDYCSAFSEGARSKLLIWLKKKSPAFRSSVKLSASKFARFTKEDVAFWAEYFLNHFRKEESGFASLSDQSETESRSRFLQLLRISSNCRPLLIIADHLDHCHGSETAGMEIATALTAIVENVSNCVLIVSINQDLWESVFEKKLPSALVDRLNRESLLLAPVGTDEGRELVVNRLCSAGVSHHQAHRFANLISEEGKWAAADTLYPRQILRAAKELWREKGCEFHQPPTPPVETIPTPETDNRFPCAEQQSAADEFPLPGVENPPLCPGPHPANDLPAHGQVTNPFEGHSMTYPDRPAPAAPVPQPWEEAVFRNYSPPVNQVPDQPQNGSVYANQQPNQATLPKDEPDLQPAPKPYVNGKPVNGKINGDAQHNATRIPAQESKKSASPLDIYFDQLVDHFAARADTLDINFPSLENFIKTVGDNHRPLTQSEVTVPGGQSNCLKWALANYTIWIGFEPAGNIYFYNNVLQKLLSDPSAKPGKIVCFAHSSHPYSHELLTSNGLTGDLLKCYFDFVQLSNDELVIISAASQFLRETTEKGYQEQALKFLIKKLNPLWQRLCQPLDQSAT